MNDHNTKFKVGSVFDDEVESLFLNHRFEIRSISSPLEPLYRDARAGILHQRFTGYDGRGWLGKLAFGLPPDVTPRWE